MAQQVFWMSKSLKEMSETEWESLCDGCGKCCLHKLEDDDNGDVYYTKVACRYLNIETCRCSDYMNRASLVDACVTLNADNIDSAYWLPLTCAYRLLNEGKPLPEWHPLVSGNATSVKMAAVSVNHFAISEESVPESDYETHILNWAV